MSRILGRIGITVSEIGFGCRAIGGPFTMDGKPDGWGAPVTTIRALSADKTRLLRVLRFQVALLRYRRLWRTEDGAGPIVLGLAEHPVRRAVCSLICGRRGRHLQLDAASWQTPWMGERIDPLMSQITSPEQVTLAWDGNFRLLDPGQQRRGVGFPFLPVDISHVAPVADRLFAGLSPECRRLLIGRTADTLADWMHIQRNPSPLVAHRGTISHLQSLPSSRGRGSEVP